MTEREFVPTSLGMVVVEDGGDLVTVTFDGNDPRNVRVTFSDGRMTACKGKTPPKPYQEVTQNGHTFEVQGSKIDPETGAVMLLNEQGVWEHWDA